MVSSCFKGTPSRVAGASFRQLGRDALRLHAMAYQEVVVAEGTADAHAVPHPGACLQTRTRGPCGV